MEIVGSGLANALTGAGVDADASANHGTGAGIAANATGMTTPVTVTAMTVMALIHRALDDATEDTAEDTAQEGFSRGGLLNDGLGVDDGNDLRGSRSDRLQTRDTGQIKAGHVNGGFEEELAGLT